MNKEGKRSKIIKERKRNKTILAVVLILLAVIVAAAVYFIGKKKKQEEEIAGTSATEAAQVIEGPEGATEEAAAGETAKEEAPAEATETGATETGAVPEEEAGPDSAMQELETELNDYISLQPGKWSICLERVDSGKKIEINADEKMRSASLIKLFIAGCCFEDLENGAIGQDKEEILGKIERMIAVSDNDTCNELIDLLGFERINEFIEKHNYTSSVIARHMLEKSENDNYTSAADCSTVLKQILDGTFVSKEASETMLSYLSEQEKLNKIPAGVPEGVKTANKTGELDNVQNDAAIVWAPGGTYILCVMSENEDGAYEFIDKIVEISSMVYDKIGEKGDGETAQEGASEEIAGAGATENAGAGSTEDAGAEATEDAGTEATKDSERDGEVTDKKDEDAGKKKNGRENHGHVQSSKASDLVIDKKIEDMSLEDKIRYLVMPSPEEFVSGKADVDGVTVVGETTLKNLKENPGVVGFSLSGRNVENSDQFGKLVEDMKAAGNDMPKAFLLSEETIKDTHMLEKLGVDVGTDMYLNPLLKVGSYEDASRAGTMMGEFLTKYGINIYQTPDLNDLTEQQMTDETDVIGGYTEGLRSNGILVCASYFPEKSDKKDEDGFYSSDKTRYEIDDEDSAIMKLAIDRGADMIMVPNCRYPQILSGGELASMSGRVMTEMIRNELGFEGVIITDVMSGDQLGNYTPEEAAVTAIENGADMVLMPDDYEAVIAGIRDAVKSGKLSEERINESVQRVYDMLSK